MERENIKKILEYLDIGILCLSTIFLILNLETITIRYSWSGSLPVISYKSYSSIDISSYFILIILISINLLIRNFNALKSMKPYIIAFTPFFSIILSLLIILNPHSLVINPISRPPARLESFEIGGVIYLILSSIFITSSFFLALYEETTRKYIYILGISIIALFLSDFIHESGHVVFALISGGDITEFYPFPVLMGGEFTAGYVGFKNVPSNLQALVLLGGEIFQWTVIITITFILTFKPHNRANLFLTILLIISLLDFPLYAINNSMGLPHWFLIGSTDGDIVMFSSLTGIPMGIMIILACIQLALGALIIYFIVIKKEILIKQEKF